MLRDPPSELSQQPESKIQKHKLFNRKIYAGAFLIGLCIAAISSTSILIFAPPSISIPLLGTTISAVALSAVAISATIVLASIFALLARKSSMPASAKAAPKTVAERAVPNAPTDLAEASAKTTPKALAEGAVTTAPEAKQPLLPVMTDPLKQTALLLKISTFADEIKSTHSNFGEMKQQDGSRASQQAGEHQEQLQLLLDELSHVDLTELGAQQTINLYINLFNISEKAALNTPVELQTTLRSTIKTLLGESNRHIAAAPHRNTLTSDATAQAASQYSEDSENPLTAKSPSSVERAQLKEAANTALLDDINAFHNTLEGAAEDDASKEALGTQLFRLLDRVSVINRRTPLDPNQRRAGFARLFKIHTEEVQTVLEQIFSKTAYTQQDLIRAFNTVASINTTGDEGPADHFTLMHDQVNLFDTTQQDLIDQTEHNLKNIATLFNASPIQADVIEKRCSRTEVLITGGTVPPTQKQSKSFESPGIVNSSQKTLLLNQVGILKALNTLDQEFQAHTLFPQQLDLATLDSFKTKISDVKTSIEESDFDASIQAILQQAVASIETTLNTTIKDKAKAAGTTVISVLQSPCTAARADALSKGVKKVGTGALRKASALGKKGAGALGKGAGALGKGADALGKGAGALGKGAGALGKGAGTFSKMAAGLMPTTAERRKPQQPPPDSKTNTP